MNLLAKLGAVGAFSVLSLTAMGVKADFVSDAAAKTDYSAECFAVSEDQDYISVYEAASDVNKVTRVVKYNKKDGKYYYYVDGVLQKCGWATIGGKKYYFSTSTGEAYIGAKKISNKYYVFSTNGVMKKDVYVKTSDGKRFYLDSYGRAVKGLVTYVSSGKEYTSFFDGNGGVFAGGLKKIDEDNWYYFGTSGYAMKGGRFKSAEGKVYYANADGTLIHKGWTTVGGRKYYFSKSNASALVGIKKVGGYNYLFDKNGILQLDLGYYKDSETGKQYFFKANGRSVTGVVTYTVPNGSEYISYFDGEGGLFCNGYLEYNGEWYFFKENGFARRNELFKNSEGRSSLANDDGTLLRNIWWSPPEDPDKLYYFGADGISPVGAVTIEGKTYIFNTNGTIKKNGFVKLGDGRQFYLDENGVSCTGLYAYLNTSGTKCIMYFNGDGTVKSDGFNWVNGELYYFKPNGLAILNAFFTDESGRNYYAGDDGKFLRSCWWSKDENGDILYYFAEDGGTLSGLQVIDGKTYIFNTGGTVRKNTNIKLSDGSWYYLGEDGAAVSGLIEYKNSSGVKCITYFNGDGTVKTGEFYEEDGKLYYLKSSGLAAIDSVFKADDKYYYAATDGAISRGGLTLVNDDLYLFDTVTGEAMVNSFYQFGTKLYYFKNNGAAAKDSVFKADGKYYYTDSERNICKNGLTWVDGELYFFDTESGEAFVGVKCVEDKYYVFGTDGKAYRSCFRNTGGLRFKLDEYGVSETCFAEDGTSLRYYNGDGTCKTGLFTVEDKIYFASSSGIINRSGYYKYDYTDPESGEAKYKLFFFDETTGEAITGLRVGRFMGKDGRGMLFDPETESGFRTGIQTFDGVTYIFYENGVAARGFFCSDEDKKLYYCDEESCILKNDEDLIFANVKLPLLEDGSLDYKNAEALGTDTGCKAIAAGFTQLFKPVNRNDSVPFGTPLDEIDGYTCTTFVVHSYYQAGVQIGFRDIVPICINMGFTMSDDLIAPGDIIFWNLTDCDTKVDEDGDPWILDSNNDGICDRIHAVDEFGDGRYYHVHHVSLALGNGQALETAAIRGVVIRNLNPSETYYPVAYGHWDDDTEGQEP